MIQHKKKLLYTILSLIFISACSESPVPFQGKVTFMTGSVKINDKDSATGDIVVKDDIVKTGIKSGATIQITDTAVITLKPETELMFSEMTMSNDKSRSISMELSRGTTFHNVLKKGTDYTVKAPTAVASVRGTSFEVSENDSKTRISVETGTVFVKKMSGKIRNNNSLTKGQKDGSEEIVLTAGQFLEVYSKNYRFSGSSSKPEVYVPKKTVNNRTIQIKENKKIEREEEKGIENIDRITLYSGKVITGTILERGEVYTILTDDGIKKVSCRDIQSNEIIR